MDPTALESPAETLQTPTWVHDAVFYQIFPDRFARSAAIPKPSNLEPWDSPPTSHGFKGGDLIGITEHLDYLQDLGANAIYLNPVFRSAANHRYHTHDYYVVDAILGGNEALRRLVDDVHRRGMRIILDGVFNHASRGFYQFHSILENGSDSPYIDWFRVHSWPLHPYGPGDETPGYEAWWNLPALPKFDTSVQAVREFLWDVGQHWIEQGIDGWRLDVPSEIDDDAFWQEFRRRVKATNPEAYIVGEIWSDARRWLRGDQFDAVMNYLFTRACLGFFAATGNGIDDAAISSTGLAAVEKLDASGFASSVEALLGLYPWQATLAQLNLLGSHDSPRFLTTARDDASAFRLSTLFLMTFPGAPCVYYGDEIGLTGGPDPGCRGSFPWNRAAWNEELRSYVRDCIGLRHGYPVLRLGSFRTLAAADNVFAFERRLGNEIAIVALNASHEDRTVDLPDYGVAIADLRAAFGTSVPGFSESGLCDWFVPARSGVVIAARAVDGQVAPAR